MNGNSALGKHYTDVVFLTVPESQPLRHRQRATHGSPITSGNDITKYHRTVPV